MACLAKLKNVVFYYNYSHTDAESLFLGQLGNRVNGS